MLKSMSELHDKFSKQMIGLESIFNKHQDDKQMIVNELKNSWQIAFETQGIINRQYMNNARWQEEIKTN